MARSARIEVPDAVRAVLEGATVANDVVMLNGELPRDLYQATDKVLRALGGRWNRSKRAHVFGAGVDVRAAIAAALGGEVVDGKKQRQAYFTPPEVADRLVALIDGIDLTEARVLEPSAGHGALIDALFRRDLGAVVHAVEVDPESCRVLRDEYAGRPVEVHEGDFLAMTPAQLGLFDICLANPPFAKGADAAHVTHAWKFVKPGGVLAAIVSPAFTFRKTKAYQAFRELHQRYWESEDDLEAGAFASSGTNIATKIVVWRKPDAANDNGGSS